MPFILSHLLFLLLLIHNHERAKEPEIQSHLHDYIIISIFHTKVHTISFLFHT